MLSCRKMCKCMRIQAKTHIIIGLGNKDLGKGRETATKDTKKKNSISFWTKAWKIYGSYSDPAKNWNGKACSLSRSYIALLMEGNGLEIRA